MEKNVEISLLLDFYRPLLTDQQQQAVDLYYNEDLSLSEIADQVGITRQGVRDLVKRSEIQLYKFESELNLYKRFAFLENGLNEIICTAQKISAETENSSVRKMAEKICSTANDLKE